MVPLTASDVGPVTDALRSEFDVDEQAVARAVRERASVNEFHRASAIKVDLFVMGGPPRAAATAAAADSLDEGVRMRVTP